MPTDTPHTSSSSSSSSMSTASSTSSSSSSPNTAKAMVVGIVIGFVGLGLIAGVAFFLLRYRRRQKKPRLLPSHLSLHPGALDWKHPASQITPFGAGPRSSPQFSHVPGQDMRIAKLRADGVWTFEDSSAPFTPSGVSDLENTPSPLSASAPSPSYSFGYSGAGSSKAKDEEEKRGKRWSRYHDYPSPDLAPPPAYNRDSVSSYGTSSIGASSVGLLAPSPTYLNGPSSSPTGIYDPSRRS